jgi:hypothetical protein
VQTPNLRSTSHDLQPRILFSQLTAAVFALSGALESEQDRSENVEEARRHLEAFELLERGPSSFNVPIRSARRCTRASRPSTRVASSSRTRR